MTRLGSNSPPQQCGIRVEPAHEVWAMEALETTSCMRAIWTEWDQRRGLGPDKRRKVFHGAVERLDWDVIVDAILSHFQHALRLSFIACTCGSLTRV